MKHGTNVRFITDLAVANGRQVLENRHPAAKLERWICSAPFIWKPRQNPDSLKASGTKGLPWLLAGEESYRATPTPLKWLSQAVQDALQI